MANREIKTTLKLEGEQQFKQAMKGASDAIKVLNSEQKLAKAQFEATGDKEQYMADKADILRRKIEEQEKAVKAAEEAVKKLKENGVDQNSKAMQEWTTKLNNAKTYLTRMQGELNNTEKELGEQADAMDDAAESAADYNDELQHIGKGIDFQNVTAILDSMNTRLNSALGLVQSVAEGIYTAVTQAGEWADEINTEASKAGIDAETYQSWLYASQFIDTEVSDIISSRQRLLKAMTSSDDETIKLFNQLGVVVRENNGDLRNQTDVFWDVIDALGKIEDPTLRDYYAQQLLGKSARELNPLIEAGSAAYKAYAQEGREVAVVSQTYLDKLQALNDAQNRLNSKFEKAKTTVLASLAPSFENATNKVGALVDEFNRFLETDEGQAALGRLNDAIDKLLTTFIDKVDAETIINGISAAIEALDSALEWLADNGWTVVAVLAGMKALMGTITVAKGFLEVLQLIKSIQWMNVSRAAKDIGNAMSGGKTASEAAAGGGGLWASIKSLGGKLGTFLANNAGTLGAVGVGVGSLYLADTLDKAYTEQHYGDYNRTIENYDAYFFDSADKRIQRMQRIMDEFKQAEEYEDENGTVDIGRIKEAFRWNANAILEALPDIDFWDYVKEDVDLSNGMNAEEIEKILGLDYLSGMTWEDLAMDVVVGLAKGIEENAAEATDAAQTMADDVTQTIEDAWVINSPSKVMMQLGEYAAQGLADGINARAEAAVQAAYNLVSRVQAALSGGFDLGGYAMSSAVYSAPAYSYYGSSRGSGAGGSVNMTLVMDGKAVGYGVAPYVDETIGANVAMGRG